MSYTHQPKQGIQSPAQRARAAAELAAAINEANQALRKALEDSIDLAPVLAQLEHQNKRLRAALTDNDRYTSAAYRRELEHKYRDTQYGGREGLLQATREAAEHDARKRQRSTPA